MGGFQDDVRDARRRILRNRRTSLAVAGALALGIGAATAVFTIAHAYLLAPPPFRAPDRLAAVYGWRPDRGSTGVSGADFVDLLREPGLFEAGALSSYAEYSWTGQSAPGFDGAEVLRGLEVTPDYFRVLDHPMAAGRGFRPDDPDAVVISYALWQRRFGGKPEVVGQTLTLNGRPHRLVGVAGRGFRSYEPYEVTAWAVLPPASGWTAERWRSSRQYDGFARLAPGTSLAQARRRVVELATRLAQAHPSTNAQYQLRLESLASAVSHDGRPAMLALAGAALCLLLIAASNAASLLLARAAGQAREMTIRAALGASRARLYRMAVAESLMLAFAAGVGGALLAVWLIAAMRALVPSSLAIGWIFDLDARVFGMAFLVSTLAGVTAGIAPAVENLRAAAGGLRPTMRRSRLLRTIATAQVALAVVLTIGAGLLGKSFVQLVERPLGYRTDSLLGMRVRLTGERYRSVDQRAAYWDELMRRAGALPGVAMASSVSDLPMGWQYSGGTFEVADRPAATKEARPHAHYIIASPGYFATLEIPILTGRGFADGDGPKAEPVAIVNDVLAKNIWPGESAIDKQVRAGGAWRRVVGVARSVRHSGPEDQHENQLYLPYRQANQNVMFLVTRTSVEPETVVGAIRNVLQSIDPNVPAFEIRSLKAAFARETAMPRLPMALTTGFAGAAALLAALGLFGVIAYQVSQRTKELGIRAAVGAAPAELRSMILRQGLRMAVVGVALGLTASAVSMRYVRSLLYGMSERDPWIYGATIALALGTALVASWLPAARASRVDPIEALREEG